MSMKLSMPSIGGAMFGVALIIGAIMLGSSNYLSFLNLEGFMIVVGGSIAVAFMSFQANYVMEAFQAIGLMFKKPIATHENLHLDMINIISWAKIVKEKGLRGLEAKVRDQAVKDPFIKYGLDMVVSNYTPEEIHSIMETAAEARYERNTIPHHVLMAMASHAPAFGMVGTLVGMVNMLGHFQADMSGIGAGLAVSLLATLYGVIAARMVFMPAAAKALQKEDSLHFRNYLITEGMSMLVANKSMQYIQDKLNSFLKLEHNYHRATVK